MNDSDRDNPKPLPEDFGMTVPNIRPSRQQPPNQSDNLDLTAPNLRMPSPNQPPAAAPPDDFGMTLPNVNRHQQPSSLPPDDFDLTAPNVRRNAPSESDFGLTMPGGGYQRNEPREPDYGATMPYISLPEAERREYQQDAQIPTAPAIKERRGGIPLWAWLTTGGLAFLAFLAVAAVAIYLVGSRNTGFTLVVKEAPPGSTVLVDGEIHGVVSSDGSIKVFGLKADERRNVKVTNPGFTDHNDIVIGENGKEKEIIAQMRKIDVLTNPPPQGDCEDPDPRVAKAECRALAELDKLVAPFTVDDLVRVLNMQIINFESGKADIPPRRERFLRRAAEKFKQLQGSPVVEIGGHTDNVGGTGSNLILSQDRAKSVRSFFTTLGVNPTMLTTRGYGATKPKTDNATEENRFHNRRIEYTVISR